MAAPHLHPKHLLAHHPGDHLALSLISHQKVQRLVEAALRTHHLHRRHAGVENAVDVQDLSLDL